MTSKKISTKRPTKVSKKAVARKHKLPITTTNGLFVVIPPYEKVGATFEHENENTGTVVGPVSEKEAIAIMDEKTKEGCDRTSITVISGRKLSLEMRLR